MSGRIQAVQGELCRAMRLLRHLSAGHTGPLFHADNAYFYPHVKLNLATT